MKRKVFILSVLCVTIVLVLIVVLIAWINQVMQLNAELKANNVNLVMEKSELLNQLVLWKGEIKKIESQLEDMKIKYLNISGEYDKAKKFIAKIKSRIDDTVSFCDNQFIPWLCNHVARGY